MSKQWLMPSLIMYLVLLVGGQSSDVLAYCRSVLKKWTEILPQLYFVAADIAHVCTQHLLVLF